jgi:hypothetical protein
VDYRYEETKDVSRFMLKGRVSARYGIAKGSLSSAIDTSSSHHTVVVNLVQKLFDVEVEEPPTQDAWFTDEFFSDGLPDKLERGEISDINPPVYVSKVTYGRMLTYTLSTTASSSDIQAMLKASVKTLAGSTSLQLETKLQKVQDSSTVEMVSIGGNQTTALTAAQTGDWGAFFQEDLKLTTAVPISMEFKNLYDNTPAGVTEAGTYTEEVCTPQIVVPGPYDFGLEDLHETPSSVDNIQQVASGDFNGDGAMDLVWDHIIGDENSFYFGLGGLGSRLSIVDDACDGDPCDFSNADIPWGQHRLMPGDYNGDGRTDLAWVPTSERLREVGYALYVLYATEDGFEPEPTSVELSTETSLSDVRDQVLVRDMNNDGADDLLFWFVSLKDPQTWQDFQILRSTPDDESPFAVEARTHGIENTDYNYPQTPLRFDAHDIDSDGKNDLLWGLLGRVPTDYRALEDLGVDVAELEEAEKLNVTHFQLNESSEDGLSFGAPGLFEHGSLGGWNNYLAEYGDFDGDGDTDIAWIRVVNGSIGAVHQAQWNGSGFSQGALQRWDGDGVPTILDSEQRWLRTADINGDGPRDIVAGTFLPTESGGPLTINAVAAMKGIASGDNELFNVKIEPQEHPVHKDWSNYAHVFIGDINGDGLDDIVWNNAALDNSVFIAFAKRDSIN